MFLLGRKTNQGVFIKLGAKVFMLGRKANQGVFVKIEAKVFLLSRKDSRPCHVEGKGNARKLADIPLLHPC